MKTKEDCTVGEILLLGLIDSEIRACENWVGSAYMEERKEKTSCFRSIENKIISGIQISSTEKEKLLGLIDNYINSSSSSVENRDSWKRLIQEDIECFKVIRERIEKEEWK